ncbi:tyrosine-protein phosphatase [Frondihabitans sp. 762G35]|uniref:tyrosine-protein phosphatase n=1 Tax=Frondihabitans sp. 762G35 TaxID=1446794 RepID=UPI0013DD7609|nr:tyrosine-protein phosphatase [Frondihabitans sp. 762G35]
MTQESTLANLRPVGDPDLQRGRRRTVFRSNTGDVDPGAYPSTVAHVVDLRRQDEIDVLPHPLRDRAGYRAVPFFDPAQSVEGPTDLELEGQYDDWIDRHRRTIALVFHALAETDGDVVVCCSAGKDRTGVVSALLARLWGADLDVIGVDYARTGPALADRFRRELAESDDLAYTRRMHRCVPETAQHLVREVERRFGSVAGYLRSLGLADAEIARL